MACADGGNVLLEIVQVREFELHSMAVNASILPPSSLYDALTPLAEMSDSEFGLLRGAIVGEKSFSLGQEEVQSLSATLRLSEVSLSFLVGAIAFLYEQIEKSPFANTDRTGTISSIIQEITEDIEPNLLDQEKISNLNARVQVLLAHSDSHDKFNKFKRLSEGFLPTAQSFSTFLDLRPVMNKQRTEIDGYLPIIQLNISTNSQKESDRSFTIQMTLRNLDKLKTCIEDVEKKIELIRLQKAFSKKIVDF